MIKTPVSDELRLAIFEKFSAGKKTENVLGIEIGPGPGGPGELIFHTKAGDNVCLVSEDDEYIYFETPTGTQNKRTLKSVFLKKIGFAKSI